MGSRSHEVIVDISDEETAGACNCVHTYSKCVAANSLGNLEMIWGGHGVFRIADIVCQIMCLLENADCKDVE